MMKTNVCGDRGDAGGTPFLAADRRCPPVPTKSTRLALRFRQQITPFFDAEKQKPLFGSKNMPILMPKSTKIGLHGGNHLQHPQKQGAELVHLAYQEGGAEVQGVQRQHEHGR